jgi:hypothetical protein
VRAAAGGVVGDAAQHVGTSGSQACGSILLSLAVAITVHILEYRRDRGDGGGGEAADDHKLLEVEPSFEALQLQPALLKLRVRRVLVRHCTLLGHAQFWIGKARPLNPVRLTRPSSRGTTPRKTALLEIKCHVA